MIYAQIKDNVIKNCIVLESENLAFKNGFDHLIRVDNIEPQPAIGWLYNADDNAFSSNQPAYIPSDLTTMVGCDATGLRELQYIQVRNILWTLLLSEVGNNFAGWGALSTPKKIIASKWGLATYAMRLSVITDEQDEEYFRVLLEETAGIHKDKMTGRSRIVEEMRQWVGLKYFRKELISKVDIDDFYSSIKDYLNDYKNSNAPSYKLWLTNAVGTPFENNGFREKTYYNEGMVTELVSIYNGNY